MKRLFLLVLLIAVAAAGVVWYRQSHSVPTDRILVSGNIELEQVNIGFKTAGRIMERKVDEGDKVTKGQVVAVLDRDQLERQRDREMAALAEAQSQLASAHIAIEYQTQAVAADLDARKADLRTTESKLTELKNGARPQELEEAKAAVSQAESEFDRAKLDWDRAQKLHKDDDISTAQFDVSRNRYETAQALLKQAKQKAALVVEGARPESIEQAQAQVMRAQAGVRASEANQLDIKRRQQEVVARQAEIERARAQIALIDSQLADTTVRSPIQGVVLVKSVDPGEVVAPGTSVVTVGDLDHPWLRAYINERDLSRVRLGSKAVVKTDALTGKTFNGRISFIASEAEFTPKQIQTPEERVKLVYRVKIDIDNPEHELKSNMPADAEILVNQ